MNELQIGIISLVRSALTGEKADIPENFNWDNALDIAKRHQIIPMLYYGVQYSSIAPPPEIMHLLELATFKNISVSQNQLYALSGIYKAFDENGIDYMPLKGSILKYIYPKPEMRPMGDADILIKLSQYDKIKKILLSIGYEQKNESDHELVWKNRALYLELHKCLFSRQNKDYYSYFGDGWKYTLKDSEQSTMHSLSIENQYIYIFVHFAKHYRVGGIGLRHLIDLWVYKQHYKNMDNEKIERALDKLKLSEFHSNIQCLLNICFANGENNKVADFILNVIFSNGSFGNSQTRNVAPSIREIVNGVPFEKVAEKRILKACFPPLLTMKKYYKILNNASFLLPVMWVVRLLNIAIFDPKKAKRYLNNVNNVSANSLSKYEEELKYVGLDFNFKE